MQPLDRIFEEVREKLAAGEIDAARLTAERAVELYGDDFRARLLRAEVSDAALDFAATIADLSAVLQGHGEQLSDAGRADVLHRRGNAHLFAQRFDEAVEDFDQEVALVPGRKAGHWQRGIACYYAGRFAEGARQFEAYQAVDRNDVENSVWWFLCYARTNGFEAAQRGLLPVGRDARVPMMTVFELFRGQATPDDVLSAVEAANPQAAMRRQRSFYAHLYLGLWHEANGRAKESLDHMRLAADEYNIGGYMWRVAALHRALREGKAAD